MTVSECPRCNERVTMPRKGNEASRVRCPLCQEEYTLGDVAAPPMLELLDDDGGYADSHIGYDLAPEEGTGVSSKAGFDFEERPAPIASSTQPQAAGTRGRRGRRQKNPAWEIAKIVAGGLLAIPVAQLILWWLPGKWQRDPFKLGPVVAKKIPWIVPKSLHKPKNQRDNDNDDQSKAPNERKGPNTAKVTPRPKNSGGPGKTVNVSPNKGLGPRTNSPPGSATSNNKQEKKQTKRPQKKIPDEPEGFSTSQFFAATVLRESLTKALRANTDWDRHDSTNADARRKAATDFYTAMAKLGHAITFVRPDVESQSHVNNVDTLLRTFARQPKKLRMLAEAGESWITSTSRTEPGVILVGAVESIGTRGKWFQTQLALNTRSKREVTIVSRRNPRIAYDVGERIVLLGSIIENPRSELDEYDGEAAFVVAGGYPIVIRQTSGAAAPQLENGLNFGAGQNAVTKAGTEPKKDVKASSNKASSNKASSNKASSGKAASDKASGDKGQKASKSPGEAKKQAGGDKKPVGTAGT